MKRFVDLRETEAPWRFAFWDTVYDVFETHNGDMAWDTWAQFETCLATDAGLPAPCWLADELERYRVLCPDWVFEPVALTDE